MPLGSFIFGGNYPQLAGRVAVVGWERVDWCIIDKEGHVRGRNGQDLILWAFI